MNVLGLRQRTSAVAVMSTAALAVLASSCGGQGQGAGGGENDPIVIGVPVGLSGANSVVAPSVVQETELAVDEINAAGGVLGRELQVKVYDDQSGANGAVQAFNTMTLKDEVAGIVGMQTSSARNAGLPIAQKANTPWIYTATYEGGACAPNLYVNATVPDQVVNPSIKYFTDELDAESWFLVGSDYAYGRGQLDAVKSSIQDIGGTVVGEEYNPIDSSDWNSILGRIRAERPDAVVTAVASGAPNVSFIKQFKSAGFDQALLNLSLDEGTVKTLGKVSEAVYYPSQYFTGLDNKKNEAFLEALKEKYGADMETPNFLSVPQYYGIHLMALAMEEAGSTEPTEVISALPEVSFGGPAGEVQMNNQHHAPLTTFLGRATADGATEIVEDFGVIEPGEQCPDLQ